MYALIHLEKSNTPDLRCKQPFPTYKELHLEGRGFSLIIGRLKQVAEYGAYVPDGFGSN